MYNEVGVWGMRVCWFGGLRFLIVARDLEGASSAWFVHDFCIWYHLKSGDLSRCSKIWFKHEEGRGRVPRMSCVRVGLEGSLQRS